MTPLKPPPAVSHVICRKCWNQRYPARRLDSIRAPFEHACCLCGETSAEWMHHAISAAVVKCGHNHDFDAEHAVRGREE